MKNILTAAASTPLTSGSPHPGLNRWPRGHSKTTKKDRTKWKLWSWKRKRKMKDSRRS